MSCLHCGLPAPAGASYCCPGCEAVAATIAGFGLADYYRVRTRAATKPAAQDEDFSAFDDPAFQSGFVRAVDASTDEAELLVEGMRCAACAWLIEKALGLSRGVDSAQVGFASRKLRVRWQRSATRPSAILATVRSVGYSAWPYEPERARLVEEAERRNALRRLWVAGLGMMQVMMYAVPGYIAGDGDMSVDLEGLMRWAGLVLTIPVVAYSAFPFFQGALRDLQLRHLGMDVPVALGIAVAFVASAAATASGRGEVYFDSIAMFVFLLLGGRYLELVARARAGRSLQHLARLVPRNAQRLTQAEGLATETVPLARLAPGDRVLVRNGETLPADGELEGAEASVSSAWLSGESRPLARRRGDALLGGSINAGPALVLRVRRTGSSTAIAAIQRMMQRALDDRPPWVAAAQRASAAFVGLVLVAALVAGISWWAVDASRAVWIAVSVLVVTCPCALALATPTALVAASGALARRNVVIARAGAIERLAAATDVVFDKTGTLTAGRPQLRAVTTLGRDEDRRCRAVAAALARTSSHPLDRAIAAESTPALAVADIRAEPGEGLEGTIDGRRFRMGRAAYVGALHRRPPPALEPSGDTTVWLGDTEGPLAALRLGDTIRPEAPKAIAELRRQGLAIHMLSGDAWPIAKQVAASLDIYRSEGEATPARKAAYVGELQAGGARVLMVGDGINDAPVLARAHASVAMGGGADLAQVGADAVLLSDSLEDLAAAVGLARRTRTVIRQNIAWALGYNLLVIPLAVAGWVTPLVAGLAMSGSSLLVVANAMRLMR